MLHRARHQLGHAGALDHQVGLALLRHVGDVAGVVLGAERAHRLRLHALGGAVEHVHLEVALLAHERGQQPDRAGAGHEHALVDRARARGDPVDLLPGLGEDARRLGEHAERAELVGDRDREVLLDGHELRAVAVERLDAPLGVLAVAAHVPLALGAAGAGHRIGPADDARDELARLEPAAAVAHAAEQLVAEHQPLVPGGGSPWAPSRISRSVPQTPR